MQVYPNVIFIAALLTTTALHSRLVSAADQFRTPNQSEMNDKIWRTQKQCGINALYMALRLRGYKVSYGEIETSLPVKAAGISIIDLRDCAKSFGADASILKVPIDQINSVPRPFIAHFQEEQGHFVVVLNIGRMGDAGGSFVELLDGTTAFHNLMPINQYRKMATGYILALEPQEKNRPLFVVCLITGGLTLLVLSIDIALMRPRRISLSLTNDS